MHMHRPPKRQRGLHQRSRGLGRGRRLHLLRPFVHDTFPPELPVGKSVELVGKSVISPYGKSVGLGLTGMVPVIPPGEPPRASTHRNGNLVRWREA